MGFIPLILKTMPKSTPIFLMTTLLVYLYYMIINRLVRWIFGIWTCTTFWGMMIAYICMYVCMYNMCVCVCVFNHYLCVQLMHTQCMIIQDYVFSIVSMLIDLFITTMLFGINNLVLLIFVH